MTKFSKHCMSLKDKIRNFFIKLYKIVREVIDVAVDYFLDIIGGPLLPMVCKIIYKIGKKIYEKLRRVYIDREERADKSIYVKDENGKVIGEIDEDGNANYYPYSKEYAYQYIN